MWTSLTCDLPQRSADRSPGNDGKFFLEGGVPPRRDEKSTERTDSTVVMSHPSRLRVRKDLKINEIVGSVVLGQCGREQWVWRGMRLANTRHFNISARYESIQILSGLK